MKPLAICVCLGLLALACGEADTVEPDGSVDGDSDSDTCAEGTYTGDVTIFSMNDLAALAGYTSIAGELGIDNCSMCDDLGALGCLGSVSGTLAIAFVEALPNVDGLDALTSVGGDLIIYDNASLADLDGLAGLTEIGEMLTITSNGQLPDCAVCDLLDQLGSEPADIEAGDNLDDACTPVPDNCP